MAKRSIDLSDEKDCEIVPLPVLLATESSLVSSLGSPAKLLVSTESSLESSLGSPAKSLAMSLEKECELVILPVLLPSIESSLESSLGSPAKSLALSMAKMSQAISPLGSPAKSLALPMAMMSPVLSRGTSLGSPAKSPASSMAMLSPVRSPVWFNTHLLLNSVTNVPLILCTYLYLIYIYIFISYHFCGIVCNLLIVIFKLYLKRKLRLLGPNFRGK